MQCPAKSGSNIRKNKARQIVVERLYLSGFA